MPLGLTNVVVAFETSMDLVLSGVSLNICIIYLDGTIIQHLNDVSLIPQKLQ